MYNDTVEEIIKLENDENNKNQIFVIRPSETIRMKRVEKDENKLQEMYDLGRKDAEAKVEELKAWMS